MFILVNWNLISVVISAIGIIVAIIIPVIYLPYREKKKKYSEWKKKYLDDCRINDKHIQYFSSRLFIPTQTLDEKSSIKHSLIDIILSGIYSGERKRYIILSDAGTGKTTFAIALVYFYIINKRTKKKQFPIYFFSLGRLDNLTELERFKQNPNSVLVLDALDENIDAANDPLGYMKRLENATDDFRVVIITSRTKLFPNEEAEPRRWSVLQTDPGHQPLFYDKYYISPLEDEEIKDYLQAKYEISDNYRKAIKIIDNTEDLMMRPLVLSFMDDLLPLAEHNRILIVEIFLKIIDKWLEMEVNRRGRSHDPSAKKKLYDFSKKIALLMYEKWEEEKNNYHINPEEYEKFRLDNEYDYDPYSLEEGTLLNRDTAGALQFSHRVFWEFFLALTVIENPRRHFNPSGFPVAVTFYSKIHKLYLEGTRYEYINYYEPKNVTILEPNTPYFINKLNDIIKICNDSCDDEEFQQKLFCNKILSLTDELFSWLPYVMIDQKVNDNYINDVLNAQIAIHNFIDPFLFGLFLLFNKINDNQNFLSVFKDKLMVVLDYIPPINDTKNSEFSFSLFPMKEILLFPCFGVFVDELKDIVTTNSHIITIGRGFSDDKALIGFISSILNIQKIIPVFVEREGDNLDEHVKFIIDLSELLNKKKEIEHPIFFVKLFIKGKISLFAVHSCQMMRLLDFIKFTEENYKLNSHPEREEPEMLKDFLISIINSH